LRVTSTVPHPPARHQDVRSPWRKRNSGYGRASGGDCQRWGVAAAAVGGTSNGFGGATPLGAVYSRAQWRLRAVGTAICGALDAGSARRARSGWRRLCPPVRRHRERDSSLLGSMEPADIAPDRGGTRITALSVTASDLLGQRALPGYEAPASPARPSSADNGREFHISVLLTMEGIAPRPTRANPAHGPVRRADESHAPRRPLPGRGAHDRVPRTSTPPRFSETSTPYGSRTTSGGVTRAIGSVAARRASIGGGPPLSQLSPGGLPRERK
jgi:hypothetical protein